MPDLDQLRAAALRNGQRRTVDAGAIVALLLMSGWLAESRGPAAGAAESAARALLGELVAAGLPTSADGRFDPTEVIGLLVVEGMGGSCDAWESHYVATGRRLVRALAGAADGAIPNVATLPPRRFAVHVSRTFAVAHVPAGQRLRLRMPLPIEDAHLTDLKVRIAGSEAAVTITPGRIEAQWLATGAPAVTLDAQLWFTASPGLPHGRDEGPDEIARWTGARDGMVALSPRIAALAERWSEAGASTLDQVHRLRDRLIDGFACGPIHADRIPPRTAPDWVLDNGWYDCRAGALLLVALCRARGIPARLIGGILLWDAPTEHYWMEAWIAGMGWTPFDLLAWDLSAGGRDRDWRGLFAGAIDYRMKTQIFPDIFTGAPGVPMGRAWHRLPRAIPGGSETRFVSADDGAPVFTDTIRILTA